jgi:hypothetical protein
MELPKHTRNAMFVTANIQEHWSELLSLNVAYMSWVFAEIDKFFGIRSADLAGMEAPDYVASILDKICDRSTLEGIFCLVKRAGQFCAMGSLRRLSADTAEIKRIYVHPGSCGATLDELILERQLDSANSFGYRRGCLETAPFMKSAHRIYDAAGFVDPAPYPEAEVPKPFTGAGSSWRALSRRAVRPNPSLKRSANVRWLFQF